MVTQRVRFGEVFAIRDQQALTADNVCPRDQAIRAETAEAQFRLCLPLYKDGHLAKLWPRC